MPFDPSTATVDEAPPVAAGFDPSTAQFSPKPQAASGGGFDPSTAQFAAPSKSAGFDPSTAHFQEETTLQSAPEEGWLHKAYRTFREAISPVVGPTAEQQAQREYDKQGLAKNFPQIASQAEAGASDVEKKGLTGATFGLKTPWSLPTNDEPVREKSNAYFEALLTPKDESDPKSLKVAKALYTPIAHTLNAMTSPVGLATMGLSAAGGSISATRSAVSLGSDLMGPAAVTSESAPLVHALEGSVAAIFASDMGRSLAESAPDLVAKIKDPNADFQDKLQASVEFSLNAAFVGLAGHGAYENLKPEALTGKTQAQKVDMLAEASGKTHEDVIKEVQGHFDELLGNVGKPESVLAQEKRREELRTEFENKSQPDAATTPAEKLPRDDSDWRYEIYDGRNQAGNRMINVTRRAPDGTRESRPIESWLSEGHDIPQVPEGHPRGSFTADEIADNARATEEVQKSQEGEQLQLALDRLPPEAEKVPEFGLGAASRAEMTPNKTLTGIRNAITDEDRVKRGLDPAMEPLRRAHAKVWDEAMDRIENPNGRETVDELIARNLKEPSAHTDVEAAMLAHRKVDLDNQFDKVVERIANGVGSDVTKAVDRQTYARLADELGDLYDVMNTTGTKAGQALSARQMIINEDYSPAQLTAELRAKLGGRQLTEEEQADVVKTSKRLKETKEALTKKTKVAREAASDDAADKAVDEIKKDVAKEDPEKAKEFDPAAEKEHTISRLKELAKEDPPLEDLRGLIQKLAYHFVREGVKERGALVDAVHGVVKDIVPGLQRRQTMDLISGYGDFTPLDMDPVKAQLRELKGQLQQVSKLEDMQKGQAPLASGRQRPVPGDEWRTLTKQVNEMKRKGGFIVTDPVKQLKTALEGIKTRLTNQIADLAKQIDTKTRLIKTKTGIKLDAEAEALVKQRDALKEQFDQIFQKPELTDAQRLAIAEKAADRQITELERQIRMQEVFPKGAKSEVTSPLLEAKRARIDALKQEREYVRDLIQPEADPKTPTEIREAALSKQIEELERQIRNREVFPRGAKEKVASPEIAAKEEQLKALREERDYLRDEIQPGRLDAQRNKALKTSLLNRTADLQERIANNDFGPRPKNPKPQYDAETERLQAEYNDVRHEWERKKLMQEVEDRTRLQKIRDTFVKYRRGFLLSNPVTLLKLTAAAAARTVITPVEEAVGGVISKALPGLAKRAPREGGLNVQAEAKALTEGFTAGMKDAWEIWKTGRSALDAAYGKGADGKVLISDVLPREYIDYLGSIHGMLKSQVKRAEFARSFEKRAAYEIANDGDMTDPGMQLRVSMEAYKDAERAIFQQENWVVDGYNRMLNSWETDNKGETSAGRTALVGTLRALNPIVRVPTNLIAEALQYTTGLATGSVRMGLAFRAGLETLSPEKADLIMRELKKGSLGSAVLLLGFLTAESAGGFYDGKRKRTDLKPGTIQFNGVTIPSWGLHNPLAEVYQVGATVARVAHQKAKGQEKGVDDGALAAALGLIEEVPFVRQDVEVAKLFDPQQRANAAGQLVKGIAVPQAVSFAAEQTDRDAKGVIPRKTEGPLTAIQSGIPGLREELPVDQRKANRR